MFVLYISTILLSVHLETDMWHSTRDGNSCRLSDFAGSILELPEGFGDFVTKISDSVMQKTDKMSSIFQHNILCRSLSLYLCRNYGLFVYIVSLKKIKK